MPFDIENKEIDNELNFEEKESKIDNNSLINDLLNDISETSDMDEGKSYIKDNPEKMTNEDLLESAFAKLDDEKLKNCPIDYNNGRYDGERGNSMWNPDPDYIPKKVNPDGKTWAEIFEKYGIDGIPFKDGEPDFGEISKGNVEIDSFSNRSDNFDNADKELANQRGCSPDEVRAWRNENKYTWHECKDMKTLQKVPSEVHSNVSHSGGISESKKGMDI